MLMHIAIITWCLAMVATVTLAQQQCYYGAGAQYRGDSNLVPCNSTGSSACCLQGDTCLSGNACYNFETGNVYQYGCTDIKFTDKTCPYKCGFDPAKSPWTAMEYCDDVQDLSNTWICHGPESCGCEWNSTKSLLVLAPRGCKDMGSDALIALYAPKQLAPYVSLPATAGGSTGYYSPTVSDGTSTWVETAVPGYTPDHFTQLTTYRDPPTTSDWVAPRATPGPSTYASAASYTAPAIKSVTTTTTPSLTSNTNGPSQGMSTGAKAGIGAGVAGGVLFLAAVAIAVWLLRRRTKRITADHPPPPQYPQGPHLRQMAGYPPTAGMPWTPYPQAGVQDQFYNTGYRSQDQSPPSAEYDNGRSMKENKAVAHHRVPSAPEEVLRPMELEGEGPQSVHEIGGRDDGAGK